VRAARRDVSDGTDETGAVLAIPEGWLLDPAGGDRLRRQLARAGSKVTAIVAERDELLPGSSHRVSSERRALARQSTMRPERDLTVQGAVMVRPGVGFEIGDGVVRLDRGPILVDQGVVAHDPWQPIGRLEDASPLGRPLEDRPVALFLGFERDPYLADWVRTQVNELVRRDVEARIAVPASIGGLHLTKPCAPTEASVGALAPEVVVALDDAAVQQTAAWLGRRRYGLVRLTPDTTDAIHVTSGRTGSQRYRGYAEIGRGIAAESMAALVRRLHTLATPIMRSS
jgi:hypothetical protein